MSSFDFIGDIHGHADRLEELFSRMEYRPYGKGFRHSGRKALFVGDYIDRGPDNPRVVEIVRSMVDAGDAIALCGNHEHNAICFNTQIETGYVRPHSIKNFKQHCATLLQFHGNQRTYDDAIAWFKTLPLFLETDEFRVVHAAWNHDTIDYLRQNTKDGVLEERQYESLTDRESKLYEAVEITCKGEEAALPPGKSFLDKDGTRRAHIRTKWWLDPHKHSIAELSILEDLDLSADVYLTDKSYYYSEKEKPVFFGHYWLQGAPQLYRNNICCLDYSVAKEGYLCAYRYSGEKELSNKNFVYV